MFEATRVPHLPSLITTDGRCNVHERRETWIEGLHGWSPTKTVLPFPQAQAPLRIRNFWQEPPALGETMTL